MSASSTSSLSGSSHSTSQDAESSAAARTKRWASQPELEYDEDQEDDLLDSAPRSKRAKASASGSAAPKAGSRSLDQEKEHRRTARMVRNRNAAQASRDRKKDHTNFLENRVAELEALVKSAAAGSSAPSVISPAATSNARARARPAPRAPVTPVPAVVTELPNLVELEDENDTLRAQLHHEQQESLRLRLRLESLEDKFARLEEFMTAPLSPLYSPPSSLAAIPSDPSLHLAQSPTEPTFAFDSADVKPTAEALLLAGSSTGSSHVAVSDVELIASAAPLVADPVASGASSPSAFAPLPYASTTSDPSLTTGLDEFVHVWGDWANGLTLESETAKVKEEDDCSMEFLDLSYLHDAPVALVC
ncbi:hypothetical protein RQP46_006507 [Phenoliferia psychrophenolica]